MTTSIPYDKRRKRSCQIKAFEKKTLRKRNLAAKGIRDARRAYLMGMPVMRALVIQNPELTDELNEFRESERLRIKEVAKRLRASI